jgi:prepilin-type N-terminal cleavage/methylation domain-containing protein
MSAYSFFNRRGFRSAFTLIEVLVVITVIGVLFAILLPSLFEARQNAKNMLCKNNLRSFALADLNYLADFKRFPPDFDITTPSSIPVQHLQLVGNYLGLAVPSGTAAQWPSRTKQPKWINCPFAVEVPWGDGVTVGGGRYTGYLYVGGIHEWKYVKKPPSAFLGITVKNPKYVANFRNDYRGVLWTDLVDEFAPAMVGYTPRRYEFYHIDPRSPRDNLTYYPSDLKGFNKVWSDASVEWVQGPYINLNESGPDLQLQYWFGNYYF